jgi:nicotinate phosphoribosyltransferase
VHPLGRLPDVAGPHRVLTTPLVRDGAIVGEPDLAAARELVASGLRSLPWEGLSLSPGDPAIPTQIISA